MLLKNKITGLVAAMILATGSALTFAAEKPAELKVGISTYLSGSASVFGVPAKQAADIIVEDLNAKGGIGGVPVKVTYIDEGGGSEKCCQLFPAAIAALLPPSPKTLKS